MKITKGIAATVPYAVIAAFALLNGAGMANVIYRTVKKELTKRERAKAGKQLEEAAFRTVLTRLKKQGLIENPSRGMWQMTKKGLGIYNTVSAKQEAYREFIARYGKNRDTIIIFDIPKEKDGMRDYLRAELVDLGYELLQKSVWIGGGPLPEQFLGYLKEGGILSAVHIFTIAKQGTIYR